MSRTMIVQVLVIFQVHFLMAQNLFSNETIVQSDNQTNTTTIENRKNEDHFVPMDLNDESSTPSNCEQRDKPYFLPHTLDSSRFYVCVKGLMFLLNCPTNYQFNGENNQCVRNHKPVTPTVMPHETNCGWYYVVREEDPFERVANSCPMPQLFDSTLLECRNFTQVKCNGRFEPKDACDYQIRSSAHAYPCSYMPSCKNRADGLYPDRLRDCRTYFRCTSERSSESFSCSQSTLPLGERFSFEEQRCLPAQYVECPHDQKPF